MDHLTHFQLTHDPFQNESDPRFFFESAALADARRRLDRALRQRKGLVLLVGESGVGKTVLARNVWEGLEDEIFESHLTLIMPGAADASSVLRRFALQLGIEEPAGERPALLAQLSDELSIVREDGRHAVLILDDAHALGSGGLIDLGGLLNLEYEDRRLLTLLLVGPPELDEVLCAAEAVGQRLDVRTRLQPLDFASESAYLAHRIQVAGGSPQILSEDALAALSKYALGRLRSLNTLADNALFEAFLAGRNTVEGADVERAATDLGLGPDPAATHGPLLAPPSPLATASTAQVALASDPGASRSSFSAAAPPIPAASLGGSSGEVDLGELLDAAPAPGDDLSSVLARDSDLTAGTLLDLDEAPAMADLTDSAELAEEFPPASSHAAADPAMAELTQIAFAEEEEGEGDEIDDLFVELVDG